MADMTKADLRSQVLYHLGVLAAGESATADDADVVDKAIDSVHEMLMARMRVDFLTSAIPEYAQIPLRDMVAFRVGRVFGKNGNRMQELRIDSQLALNELTGQLRYPKGQAVTEAEYF